MSTITTPAPLPILTVIPCLPPAPDGRVRFSREAYHRMFEIGVLDRQKRIELIDGEIVMMSPMGPPNGELISRLSEFFVKRLPDEYQCRVQLPIIVDDHSEPEPDLAIVRRKDSGYRNEHPNPAEVFLLVEVASTSLSLDLGAKQRLYANSQIAEYWVVDVASHLLVVHRLPGVNGYRDVKQFGSESTVAPLASPECQLDLSALFG
jgi:Uma2 family endonuclease